MYVFDVDQNSFNHVDELQSTEAKQKMCVCVLHLYREYDTSFYWYPLSYSSYIEASERSDETFGCSISVVSGISNL